jgi:multiple sugar transport system permease protein
MASDVSTDQRNTSHAHRSASPFTWLTENTLQGMARRKALLGYLFLAPTILGILIFTAGPVIFSFVLSLFRWNVFSPPEWVGAANYARMVADNRALTGFWNSFVFVLFAVTLQVALGLLLAMILQMRMPTWLRYTYRTSFLLPMLMSGAATAIVLGYMLHKEFGAVNYYLGRLGVPPVPWLTEPGWAMVSVILSYLWLTTGFTMILFIGGLTNISTEIMDAADVDGAKGIRRFWHITLPLVSPTLLFAAVTGVIGGLQVFDLPYIMTRGGPGDSTRTAVMVMYESAFKNMEIGYGSTIAVVLFLIILAVTAGQFGLSKRWVFYQ